MAKKKDREIDFDEWTDECELLLAEWSEKASCYRWLHGRCEKNYKNWYYGFSIPVIILSTLTGAANVGMDSFVPEESKSLASAIVGGVNIFAGIISTLQNFLKVAELMEGHRLAGISWGKLQRNIAIELALDRKRRVVQSDFLKLARAEYDRLIEAGPLIDDGVIKQFNHKFKNYQVAMPSICNGLDRCIIYKVKNNNNDEINKENLDNDKPDNDKPGNDKPDNDKSDNDKPDNDKPDNDKPDNDKSEIKYDNKEDYTEGVEDIILEQEKLIPNKELEIKIEGNNLEESDIKKHTCDKCDSVESLTGE
tara:strand:+ start:3487 stop:4410 length:924 start_codon:yes stop_codon:yes gene_type:complete